MVRLVAVLTCCLVLSCFSFKNASGAEYTVGDAAGWVPNVQWWVQGKKFYAGDVLIFNYDGNRHNVQWVDLQSYVTCTLGPTSKYASSGHDHIVLEKGLNFFFSNRNRDCQNNMRLAVFAF